MTDTDRAHSFVAHNWDCMEGLHLWQIDKLKRRLIGLIKRVRKAALEEKP